MGFVMRRLCPQTGFFCRTGCEQFQQNRIVARTARIVAMPSLGALRRAAVRLGDVRLGDVPPSTWRLAASLQAARSTVVEANARPSGKGFVEARGVAASIAQMEAAALDPSGALRPRAPRKVVRGQQT
ncbi:hypothetical protein [Burkholderia vietnamiensis]|uniref:hypothetical protein n=1 Tax=Burkholderia vietnamiensis TaxID=60552 RepID=UPI0012D89FA5|nr:hypothetical protein [Burkholderia vietnamiensis]HDR9093615.1 hypothetical protein [Burkholderia vietnamiensis]HDR9106648.1 hypothetical protein [Burkholderia vietnamiensis]